TDDRHLRPLPDALTAGEGEPIELTLPLEPGLSRRAVWFAFELDGGGRQRIRLPADEGSVSDAIAPDGRRYQVWRVQLPPLPVGRHILRREDGEPACHLTVAPAQCYLPPELAAGAKRFGISAQLYSLRRAGDQGIGDFTTLAELMHSAAAAGAAT